jgi:hypothetical protein
MKGTDGGFQQYLKVGALFFEKSLELKSLKRHARH